MYQLTYSQRLADIRKRLFRRHRKSRRISRASYFSNADSSLISLTDIIGAADRSAAVRVGVVPEAAVGGGVKRPLSDIVTDSNLDVAAKHALLLDSVARFNELQSRRRKLIDSHYDEYLPPGSLAAKQRKVASGLYDVNDAGDFIPRPSVNFRSQFSDRLVRPHFRDNFQFVGAGSRSLVHVRRYDPSLLNVRRNDRTVAEHVTLHGKRGSHNLVDLIRAFLGSNVVDDSLVPVSERFDYMFFDEASQHWVPFSSSSTHGLGARFKFLSDIMSRYKLASEGIFSVHFDAVGGVLPDSYLVAFIEPDGTIDYNEDLDDVHRILARDEVNTLLQEHDHAALQDIGYLLGPNFHSSEEANKYHSDL